MSWLHKLLIQSRIPPEPYLTTVKTILRKPLDPADKCEALLEVFEPILGAKPAEFFVRDVLDGYDKYGGQSLDVEEAEIGVVKPVVTAKKPLKFNVNAPEFTLYPMTTEHAAPTYTNTADLSEEAGDGDDAYLSYEEAEGYNALSPEEILQSVFMDMSMEEIQDLLEANGWNVERTLEALLKPPSESYQPTSGYGTTSFVESVTADPGRQVCRHFLAGECLRSDCWYSHDPEALVCKFWLAGGCIKGDSCPFTHGGSLMGRAENAGYASSPLASTATKKAQPVATVEDFPALGAPKPASKPKIDFWGPTQKFVDVAKKPPSARPSAVSAAYTAPKPPNRRSTKLVDVKWVSTGDTLAASYLRYRQEAIDAAIQRNKLFQRATEAYLAGNKAAAKAFSLGAHRLNERVQELHRQAGQRIFESRNTTSSIKDGSQTIDLHGLHPDEAVEMVEASIARLKREMFTGRVVIVTGTGNHSRGQKAKVLPAIREYLYRVGLRAQEASMTDGRGGIFTLQI